MPPLLPQGVLNGAKGKGKVLASLEPPQFMKKPVSPLSLEVLMLVLSLFEEPLLNDPDEVVISLLGSVYGERGD